MSIFQMNMSFMKKIPKNAEAANILVGELASLDAPVSCFIRLNKAMQLGDLTEVPLPTRFIFIFLGPPVSPGILSYRNAKGRLIYNQCFDLD